MMKPVTLVVSLLFVSFVDSWTTMRSRYVCSPALRSSGEMDGPPPTEMSENPCWQDLYDDDCSMSNAAAASFIAAKWIKSMPCGAGLEDCDMPSDLMTPAERPEGGVDNVDVMDMLRLKRAKSIKKESGDRKP